MLHDSEANASARVRKDIVEACVARYEVFGAASDSLRRVSTSGSSNMSDIDDRLSANLASLDLMSKKMLAGSTEWRSKRAVAMTAVAQSFRLTELVEAPSTLEACLACEAYHEALMIVDHVRVMCEESPQSALLQSVSERMGHVLEECISSLIFPKLSAPMTLTASIKLINFLRKLNIPDSDIRQLFLSRKLVSLQGSLADTMRGNQSAYSALSKSLSVIKVSFSEILLRYEACFGLKEPENVHELQTWIRDRASDFVHQFTHALNSVTSAAELASLSSQIEHLSSSLARVSSDLAPMLLVPLLSRTKELFCCQMRLAQETYDAAMSAQAWGSTPQSTSKGKFDNNLPMQLLQFLPLAYIANGIVSALNEIRKCAFICLSTDFEAIVDSFLCEVANDIDLLFSSRFLSKNELSSIAGFRELFAVVLVPHIESCMRKVFVHFPEHPFPRTRRVLGT